MKKRLISLLLVLVLVVSLVPPVPAQAAVADAFAGKTLSVLGDSISTYTNYSNGTAADTTNSTIRSGAVYYPRSGFDITPENTWWAQTAEALGMEVLVNNSWSGSCVYTDRAGPGAYKDRCVQLHDDTGDNAGQEPDIIAVYLGTNDYYSVSGSLGTAATTDFDALITETEDGFTYATPTTTVAAYAIMLHKMRQRYPNAEVYCFTLLQRYNIAEHAQLKTFNADIAAVAQRYGAYVVDLYNCGINTGTNYYKLMGDNLHPNSYGMDAITGAFLSAILKNSKYMPAETAVYDVTYALTDVYIRQGNPSAAAAGEGYTADLRPMSDGDDLLVTVTMGGQDVTEAVYADGLIRIPAVTGDLKITAKAVDLPDPDPMPDKALASYRWEYDSTSDALVNVTTNGNAANALTKTNGTVSGGNFSGVRYTLTEPVVLRYDQPWQLEWRASGTWSGNGGLLLSEYNTSKTSGGRYLYRCPSNMIALGVYNGSGFDNYAAEYAGSGIDVTADHVWRMKNVIAPDGTNMVYLYIDGVSLGAMNQYYYGATDKNTTSDWLSGKSFVFRYIGTDQHPISNCALQYLQVWEGGTDSEPSAPDPTEPSEPETEPTEPVQPASYRWEYDADTDALVSVTGGGNEENGLTFTRGSLQDGVYNNAGYKLSQPIRLSHDSPWEIEWQSEGSWASSMQGALLFAEHDSSRTAGTTYFYRRSDTNPKGFLGFGTYTGSQWKNYGLTLANHGIDYNGAHVFRLVNVVAEDGSNMVWLYVDGDKIGAMNGYNLNGSDQNTTSDWISGKDFTFSYFGTADHKLNSCSIGYIQVWEAGEPKLTPEYPSLSLKDEVRYNIYYSTQNLDVAAADVGLITWTQEPENGTVENAETVIAGAVYSDSTGLYRVQSKGIPAKNLADTLYFKVYAKRSDGSYLYSDLYQYDAKRYAEDRLKNSANEDLKALCVALLNYGAQAQTYFGYKTDALMNEDLTEAQKALVKDYSSGMVGSLPAADPAKAGVFTATDTGFTRTYPSVSLGGALSVNYYFEAAHTPDTGMTLYIWNEEAYDAAQELTEDNCTAMIAMGTTSTENLYRGQYYGIAARQTGETIYACGVYTADGQRYSTGVLVYSLNAYCADRVANGSERVKPIAMATAVYGYYAKTYFDNLEQ